MIISSATPSELLHWFHADQCTQRVLCILLAPSFEDQGKLVQLIGEIYTADAVLGKAVAFLLIHPKLSDPIGIEVGGRLETIAGASFPTQESSRISVHTLRDTVPFRDLRNISDWRREIIAKEASRAMACFATDFMELLNIEPRQIPALCVLVRGISDAAVLKLEHSWSRDGLISILQEIRLLSEQANSFQDKYKTLADSVPQIFVNLKGLVLESDAKIKCITTAFERILRHHKATESDRSLVAELLARGLPSFDDLFSTVQRLSFSKTKPFYSDQQVQKVYKLMRELSDIRVKILAHDSRSYILDVGEQAHNLVLERSELLERIKNIGDARLVAVTGNTNFRMARLWKHLDNINLTGDIGEKLSSSMEWIKKLLEG